MTRGTSLPGFRGERGDKLLQAAPPRSGGPQQPGRGWAGAGLRGLACGGATEVAAPRKPKALFGISVSSEQPRTWLPRSPPCDCPPPSPPNPSPVMNFPLLWPAAVWDECAAVPSQAVQPFSPATRVPRHQSPCSALLGTSPEAGEGQNPSPWKPQQHQRVMVQVPAHPQG